MAAGCTYVAQDAGNRNVLRRHEWTWVSSPDGTMSGTGESDVISGRLIQLQAIPLSGYIPTSGYSIKLVDSIGMDWLLGSCLSVMPSSCNDPENVQCPYIYLNKRPIVQNITLTPVISGAGDGKSALIRLWVSDIRKGAAYV